jgi:hypothetical protein
MAAVRSALSRSHDFRPYCQRSGIITTSPHPSAVNGLSYSRSTVPGLYRRAQRTTALFSTAVSLARALSLSLSLSSKGCDRRGNWTKRKMARPQALRTSRGRAPANLRNTWGIPIYRKSSLAADELVEPAVQTESHAQNQITLEITGCLGAVASASITAMATIC